MIPETKNIAPHVVKITNILYKSAFLSRYFEHSHTYIPASSNEG